MGGNIKYSEEEMEKIQNFGALEYDAQTMAILLDKDLEGLEKEFNDENSDFKKYYNKGKCIRDYVLDMKLFEMAQGGDLSAMTRFKISSEQRKKAKK